MRLTLVSMLPLMLSVTQAAYTESDAVTFLATTSAKAQELWSATVYADWNNVVNLTDENQAKVLAAQKAYDDYQIEIHPEVLKFPWQTFTDPLIRRQFKISSPLDVAALPLQKKTRLSNLVNFMVGNYTETKVQEYNTTDPEKTLLLEDIQAKIRESNDPCEMSYYWDAWHTLAGRAVKTMYPEYVELENEVATANNFSDAGAQWKDKYEIENIDSVLAKLLEDFRPLFLQLHAYIRRQLWLTHGKNNDIINLTGPIPASLLGNIFGLDGINIFNKTAPYPKKAPIDVSPQLKAQNYTGLKMAKTAETFYVSLNFSKMTDKFWKYSIFEKPANRDNIDCSDEAFNFFTGDDYRVKICATPIMDDFGRVHHEMGHCLNYMLWKDLPWWFQDAPNPAFNEVVSDLMYLFVTGPTHLQRVGLLDSSLELDKEQQINGLYLQALSIVFFLPYAYSMDAWRWRVLQRNISEENYNCEYWKIRLDAQGVEPPVDRDENDFDPGAKYHVAASFDYMMYFISGIVEFQLHQSLCIAAGQFDPNNSTARPEYLCDIYGSTAAGEKLKSMMALGRSYSWPDTLEKVTGTRTLDSSVLITYFQPLYEWLQQENKKNNEKLGWEVKNFRCYGKGETGRNLNNKCAYHKT